MTPTEDVARNIHPLIVSHSDGLGGAAVAAHRTHTALVESGVDSRMLVRRKVTQDPTVTEWGVPPRRLTRALRERIDARVVATQRRPDVGSRSANVIPSRLPVPEGTDLVNIHWIGGGTLSVRGLAAVGPPIVLTMHDMWAFCGAEHYTEDGPTARWRHGYPESEAVRGRDIDRWTWQRKRRLWDGRIAGVITPSTWLGSLSAASHLLAGVPHAVVPYPVPRPFRPRAKQAARVDAGLPVDGPLLLFGASGDVSDPRKGLDLLMEALSRLVIDDVHVVVFGPGGTELAGRRLGGHVRLLPTGPVTDPQRLASLYAAADVMVVPSRQDNLPQTVLEALACGTPVIGFEIGGIPDAVTHLETGFLARPFDTASLAAGIDWLFDQPDRPARLAEAAAASAARYDPQEVASSYVDALRSLALT